MSSNKIKTGRPALSDKQIDIIFQKIKPHLRAGLSIHKSCLIAKIPKSTVYDLLGKNKEFSEKIELAQNYQSILVTDIVNTELKLIRKKQKEDGGMNRDQIRFLQWIANNSRATREEFDRDFNEDPSHTSIKSLKDDSRVFKTLMGSYLAMMKNMGININYDKPISQ